MQLHEFGKDRDRIIVLLHGGGLSWWNYRDAAKLLEEDYHVILPVLDGHAGSDRPFTTIEDNAAEIISWMDGHCGGSVLLLGGLSLGAQIVLEMLSQKPDVCRHALVESAAAIPSGLTNALIGPAFGSSYALIRKKGFSRLQFRSLHIKEELFEDYYRDTCLIKKEDMISFMKANTSYSLKETLKDVCAKVHVFYGSREVRRIRQSARMIGEKIPGSTVRCLDGFRHGDFSLNHAVAYAGEIRNITD